VTGALMLPVPPTSGSLWELCLFLILAVLVGGKKIKLFRNRNQERTCSVSLGFAITFAAMLQFGPNAAVPVAMAGCLSASLYPRRHPPHQLGFNVALGALESWLAGWAFLEMNDGTLALDPKHAFLPVAVSALVYFAVNAGGVAAIVALCRGEKFLTICRDGLLWIAPSYVAGACLSTLAVMLFDRHTNAALLLWLPLAYLILQSYVNHNARMEEKETRLSEKQQHIEELQHSQTRLADLYLATIKSLALAIDAKDQYTHQHILRVQRYAVATAEQLGLTGDELEGLKTGALLHDIGKLGVPEHILLKPGRLTDDEFAKIKRHPDIGAAILDPVEFPWPVLPVVKSHHEKWDGTGYPEGLAGEDIPLTARILAVADVYDALTSNRPYRKAWTHDKAVDEIRRGRGSHFDPSVVAAFLKIMDIIPAVPEEDGSDCAEAAEDDKADQLVRDIHRATSTPWALYEVSQALSESSQPQAAFQTLTHTLIALFPGTACLGLLRDDKGDLRVLAAAGDGAEALVGAEAQEDGASWRAAHARQSALDAYDDEDLGRVLFPPTGAPRSALIVPVVHQGEVLGTINLYHAESNAFSPDDRQLLETIADHAASAVFNGLLFDRTQSHAVTDALTGLYNLRFITQAVEQRCRRPEESFALMCLDLDSFKPINDNFGHQKGDQVLRDLSDIFRSSVRDGDIVARYGGDEFLIVLQGAGALEASAMIRRLQDAVGAYDPGLVHPRLGSLRLGVSIGFGCFPDDGRDCPALMASADRRMYENKTERKLGSLTLEATPRRARRTGPAKRTVKPTLSQRKLVFRLVGGKLLDSSVDSRNVHDDGNSGSFYPRRKKCLISNVRPAKRPLVLRLK
nr:diguanylate cyclase [Armatimonadota bacterium]